MPEALGENHNKRRGKRFQAVPKSATEQAQEPELTLSRRQLLKALVISVGAISGLAAAEKLGLLSRRNQIEAFDEPADLIYAGAKIVSLNDMRWRRSPEKIDEESYSNYVLLQGVIKINGVEIPQGTSQIEVENPLYIEGQDVDGFSGHGHWMELAFEYSSGEKFRVFGFDGKATRGAIESIGSGKFINAQKTDAGYKGSTDGIDILPEHIGIVRPITTT